jgi:hypothetical protein
VKKLKNKPFRFTFGHLIRLSLFIFAVYYLINYLSKNQANYNNKPDILGDKIPVTETLNKYSTDLYQKLPSDTQQKITKLPELPIISEIKKQLNGFPQKQINQFKIDMINKISQDLVDDIKNQNPTP